MNQITENLEARLFSLIQLREYYLHQMLSTNEPLGQDTLLLILTSFSEESFGIIEMLFQLENNILIKEKTLIQFLNFRGN